jgi:hypothetical protein
VEFRGIFHGDPWNSNSMEFHETEVDGIPLNSMEFDGIRFRQGQSC